MSQGMGVGGFCNPIPTKNGLIIPFMIEASLDSTFINPCLEKETLIL